VQASNRCKLLSSKAMVVSVAVNVGRISRRVRLIEASASEPSMSAGKRRSTRVRHGAPWLKPVLVQCAWGAARTKGTYLQAQFFRLKARRGPKKAAIAVAASILTAVYHMLKDGTLYQDLGPDYLFKRDATRTVAKLARRIKDLGFEVHYRAIA
jgi:transposase